MSRLIISFFVILASLLVCNNAEGKNKELQTNKIPHVRFYDFNDLLIDGEIKKPTGLLLNERGGATFNRFQFERKSFINILKRTALEKTFK